MPPGCFPGFPEHWRIPNWTLGGTFSPQGKADVAKPVQFQTGFLFLSLVIFYLV